MTTNECKDSLSISQTIEQRKRDYNDADLAWQEAKRANDSDASQRSYEAKLSHQEAIVDLVKDREKHQSSCDHCKGLSKA